MDTDWMLDVLADMRSFALMNGMTELADQLDAAARIATRDARRSCRHEGDSSDTDSRARDHGSRSQNPSSR